MRAETFLAAAAALVAWWAVVCILRDAARYRRARRFMDSIDADLREASRRIDAGEPGGPP